MLSPVRNQNLSPNIFQFLPEIKKTKVKQSLKKSNEACSDSMPPSVCIFSQ